MINEIELENWKTHESSRIDFSRGTNILIGQMGAGKSSVLDAMSFALFGTFPSIQHRRVNVSEIIRNRPEQKESANVRLNFTLNGDNYTVRRGLSRSGGAKATLEKNGEYLQSQPQRVNEEIEKILKVDYDLFSKAIYSEQNGLEYFLNLRPTERKKQIDALLGLDKFALAQENVTSVMNRIKDIADENEKTASGFDIKKLNAQLESLGKELGLMDKEKKDAEKNLADANSRKEDQERELSTLKKQYREKLALEQEIASLKSKIETLSKEIGKIEAMKIGDEKELKGLVEKAEKALKDADNAAKENRELWQKDQTVLSGATADLNKARKEKEEKDKLVGEQKRLDRKGLEEKATDLRKQVESGQRELAEHTALMNESSKWIKELDKHLQKCPVCDRELDEQMRKKLLGDKTSSVKKLEQMTKEISSKISKSNDELNELTKSINRLSLVDDKIKAYGDVESTLEKLEKSVKKTREETQKLKERMDSASETLLVRNRELSELNSRKEALSRKSEYSKQMDDANKEMQYREKESKEIRTDQARLDSLQKELTKTSSEVSKLLANLESYGKYLADKKAQIKDKETEIEKVNALYEDVKKKRVVTENLVRFKISLQETQAVLRTKLIDSINSVMHDIWPDLYPYGDYTNIMMDATADDYILRVKTKVANGDDGWQDVDAIASGGERSISCLALRIAFSLVLSPTLKWLILDEPTHNIDQQGLERFIRMFNEVLPRIVDQTFIITHEPMLKQAYNSKVYLLSRNKDEEMPTVVEEV